MNCKALLARLTRKIKAAYLRFCAATDGTGRVASLWEKTRRRLRFLRWTLVIQLLKGAAFMRRQHHHQGGGDSVLQRLRSRFAGYLHTCHRGPRPTTGRRVDCTLLNTQAVRRLTVQQHCGGKAPDDIRTWEKPGRRSSPDVVQILAQANAYQGRDLRTYDLRQV